jgi:hypothetical protein
MRWPIEGFGPGKGITPARAAQIHIETVAYIENCLRDFQTLLKLAEIRESRMEVNHASESAL